MRDRFSAMMHLAISRKNTNGQSPGVRCGEKGQGFRGGVGAIVKCSFVQ